MFTVRSAYTRIILSCLLVIGLLVSIASPQTVRASTLTVDTLLDENDASCSDGDCALRDAIQVATASDTISFSVTGTIFLTLGPLYVDKDLTISGPGPGSLTVDGNHNGGVFYVMGNTSFSGLTIANGAAEYGGGMFHLAGAATLTNVTFSDNISGGKGGGMYNYICPATLTNVTFSNNSAPDGGGMWNRGNTNLLNVTFSNNTATSGGGGGMFDEATATLTNVAFIGNSAPGNSGGGLFSYQDDPSNPILNHVLFTNNTAGYTGGGMATAGGSPKLTNVTFSGNSAQYGGGIYMWGSNPTLTNVTLTNNSVSVYGGGIYNDPDSATKIKNTIIAGNTGGDWSCGGGTAVTSYGYNLIQDASGCTITGDETGNIYGEDALLGPLQDNGGATFTHALLHGSPAVNAADDTDPDGNPVTEDQRGVTRPQGSANDIGAYEAEAMHVQAVNLHLNGTRLIAMVAVYDQAGSPVANASVTGTVKGPNATHSFSYATNFKGIARFSGPSKSGIWQLCVTDIVKDGYTYDPSQNVKTCAMIKIP